MMGAPGLLVPHIRSTIRIVQGLADVLLLYSTTPKAGNAGPVDACWTQHTPSQKASEHWGKQVRYAAAQKGCWPAQTLLRSRVGHPLVVTSRRWPQSLTAAPCQHCAYHCCRVIGGMQWVVFGACHCCRVIVDITQHQTRGATDVSDLGLCMYDTVDERLARRRGVTFPASS